MVDIGAVETLRNFLKDVLQEPTCPLRAMRISCICLEPTLSAPTMKHLGYLAVIGCDTLLERVIFNLLIKEGGELGEVVGLPGGLVLPNHLDCELGYLCGFKDSVKENNAQHTAGEVVETVRASCGWSYVWVWH